MAAISTILENAEPYSWPENNCVSTTRDITALVDPDTAQSSARKYLDHSTERAMLKSSLRAYGSMENAYIFYLSQAGWKPVMDPNDRKPGDIHVLNMADLTGGIATDYDDIVAPVRMAFMVFWDGNSWLIWTTESGLLPIRSNLDDTRNRFRILPW